MLAHTALHKMSTHLMLKIRQEGISKLRQEGRKLIKQVLKSLDYWLGPKLRKKDSQHFYKLSQMKKRKRRDS